jgi:hypothetical protein
MQKCTSLSATFIEQTQMKRGNFKPGMHQEFKSRLCSTSKRWIFGDKLGKKMKEINGTKAVSSKLTIRSEKGSFNKHRRHPYSNSKKGKLVKEAFL